MASEPTFSVNEISKYWRKDRNYVTNCLVRAGIEIGKGAKVTIHAANDALFENTKLEREAKAARHRQQIDEAEIKRLEREVGQGKWILKHDVAEGVADLVTKLVQIFRDSKLSGPEKENAVQEIGSLRARW